MAVSTELRKSAAITTCRSVGPDSKFECYDGSAFLRAAPGTFPVRRSTTLGMESRVPGFVPMAADVNDSISGYPSKFFSRRFLLSFAMGNNGHVPTSLTNDASPNETGGRAIPVRDLSTLIVANAKHFLKSSASAVIPTSLFMPLQQPRSW